mmetsp:Transcript_19610/g.36811  ORF Transcript_19610/g.36811 Transcript_19610/m.36811 type:complete len:207 (-) Transcript_19610:272-892(-)
MHPILGEDRHGEIEAGSVEEIDMAAEVDDRCPGSLFDSGEHIHSTPGAVRLPWSIHFFVQMLDANDGASHKDLEALQLGHVLPVCALPSRAIPLRRLEPEVLRRPGRARAVVLRGIVVQRKVGHDARAVLDGVRHGGDEGSGRVGRQAFLQREGRIAVAVLVFPRRTTSAAAPAAASHRDGLFARRVVHAPHATGGAHAHQELLRE